jgi:GNAT superfamily N-acetyltransferase
VDELLGLLDAVARGEFLPQDNATDVLGPPAGAGAAILSFPAHHVVASAAPEAEVRARLDPGDYNGPLRAQFAAWLAERLRLGTGSVDVVLAQVGARDGGVLPEVTGDGHPRVARARRHRDDVRVFADERGVAVLGRGLGGRLEISFEVEPAARGRGAARALVAGALAAAPDEPVFAQCAAANAASLRALLGAGFTPLGAELLLG